MHAEVEKDELNITFEVRLKSEQTHLFAAFYDRKERGIAPYYVYIELVAGESDHRDFWYPNYLEAGHVLDGLPLVRDAGRVHAALVEAQAVLREVSSGRGVEHVWHTRGAIVG